MKRFLLAAALLLTALSAPLPAEAIEGYLIDKACSAKAVEAGGEAARFHTKECALSPACKASGYGIVTDDGRFLKFDEDGDGMAVKMLGVTSRTDNLRVVVNGTIEGETIKVVAIQLA